MLGVLFSQTADTGACIPCHPKEEKPMVVGSDQHASLPPHYAFVVQLAADTQVETGQIYGRVEHVVSRHATHFASLETLRCQPQRRRADPGQRRCSHHPGWDAHRRQYLPGPELRPGGKRHNYDEPSQTVPCRGRTCSAVPATTRSRAAPAATSSSASRATTRCWARGVSTSSSAAPRTTPSPAATTTRSSASRATTG